MANPQTPVKILIVDDDEGLLVLMASVLREEGFEVATAISGMAALEWLSKQTPDLMLLDLQLNDLGGEVLVERIKGLAVSVPFVVVTGQGDEKVAVGVMKQGALDYVMKDSGMLDLLPTVIHRALDGVAQRRALKAAEAESRRLEQQMIEVAELERQRIGADLHDGLGQQLTAIELYCVGLKEEAQRIRPSFASTLDQMGKMLREAIAQTRALSRGLVPVGDDPDALRAALKSLVERTQGLGRVRLSFDCTSEIPILDRGVAGHLYRIAQESINNALKHSGAHNVAVALGVESGRLRLEISDDGKGLAASKPAGVGQEVMRHRAKVIGAELTIASTRGQGVLVTCLLPIANEANRR